MKIQASDLKDLALDWAVHYAIHGECEGYSPHEYSTDWAQGGPIIEREKLAIEPYQDGGWICTSPTDRWHGNKSGPTPLIAAMRCYVASKLGDTVDVPEELTKG
jgi:hypothetical protein